MSNNITSHDQKGGVTAQNVNVSIGAPKIPPSLPEEIKPRPMKRILAWVAGGIGIAASVTGVLEYFGVTPW